MIRKTVTAALLAIVPGWAVASQCHTFVEDVPGVRFAQLHLAQSDTQTDAAPFKAPEVEIEYIAHSTYRITSEAGVVIATDFFGAYGGGTLPDVVTMNHAHETHYTDYPDPAIKHVLRGWGPEYGVGIEHYVEFEDVLVRNVTTDLRGWGESGRDGNSIFVFEIADLCIGHLGHLHHDLDEAQYAMLGRLDIVMTPVDGTWTLDTATMLSLMKRLKSRIVLPMHIFGPSSMQRFVSGLSSEFEIRRVGERKIRVSLETLPRDPTVMVLSNHSGGVWE